MSRHIQYRIRRGNVWYGAVDGMGFDHDLETGEITIVDSQGKAYPHQEDYAQVKADIEAAGLKTKIDLDERSK